MERASQLKIALYGFGIAGAVAVSAALFSWGLNLWSVAELACQTKRDAMEMAKSNGCLEFWLNRYQTTVQTLISSVIGGVGLYFILRQLKELGKQNTLTRAVLEENQRIERKNTRIAKARMIEALEAYITAAGAMMSENIFRAMNPNNLDPRKLDAVTEKRIEYVAAARKSRIEIISLLDDEQSKATFRAFEGEFETLADWFDGLQNPGPRFIPTRVPLSIRFQPPANFNESMQRISAMMMKIGELRGPADF